MPAKTFLMLRSAQRARLEARTPAMQRFRAPLKATVSACLPASPATTASRGNRKAPPLPARLLPDEIITA